MYHNHHSFNQNIITHKNEEISFTFTRILSLCAVLDRRRHEGQKKMSEEIQKFKIDYLAKEMGLSEAEKAKFEPIYNEYDEARRKAGAEAWRFERKLKKRKRIRRGLQKT